MSITETLVQAVRELYMTGRLSEGVLEALDNVELGKGPDLKAVEERLFDIENRLEEVEKKQQQRQTTPAKKS